VDDALKSLTLWGAYQHHEGATRGSIEVGKLADFVTLDANPHKVKPGALADLKVIETIKEGKCICTAK
jgi:predicted amidohydrolase YtcJ